MIYQETAGYTHLLQRHIRNKSNGTETYQPDWYAWARIEYLTQTIHIREWPTLKKYDRLVDQQNGDVFTADSVKRGEGTELIVHYTGGTPDLTDE